MTVPQITNKNADNILDVVDACPVSVFVKSGNGIRIKAPNDCIGCSICVNICKGIKLKN